MKENNIIKIITKIPFRIEREIESKLCSAFEQIKLMAKMTSHDPDTQVGAAILCPETLRIIATSVNGFIHDAEDDLLPNQKPLKHLYMRHAERNLINYCARKGIRMEDKLFICTHSCCYECARSLWDAGIQAVIFEKEHSSSKESFKDKLDLDYIIGDLSDEEFPDEVDRSSYSIIGFFPKTREDILKFYEDNIYQ